MRLPISHLTFCIIYAFIFFAATQSSCFAQRGVSDDGERYNILLISMDTLRYDHLSFSGYKRATSPNIDTMLAEEGIVFSNAISQSSWTLPSNVSVLTSQYVPAHGVDNAFVALDETKMTLTEILKLYGYHTAAFTGGFHLSRHFGFDHGFDVYDDQREHGRLEDILPRALAWLRLHGREKFFLFLQAYDCHAPFKLPGDREHIFDPHYNGIIDRYMLDHGLGDLITGNRLTDPVTGVVHLLEADDIAHIVAHYDAAIAHMDEQIGAFLRAFQQMGLFDKTIVVFMGDHGEELMDHGGRILKRKHGDAYEEGIRVPLIIRHPAFRQKKGRVISAQAQLIDVMPTLLDCVHIAASHTMQGHSLLPFIMQKRPTPIFNKYVFTGTYHPDSIDIFPQHMAIRTRQWKLIHIFDPRTRAATYELYRLAGDSSEKHNVINRFPSVAGNLKKHLWAWWERSRCLAPAAKIDYQLFDAMKKRMQEFGYWWVGEEKKHIQDSSCDSHPATDNNHMATSS